ncbi:hypothetical protein [Natronococcus sp.]|uniref:hypothetical protein n=1 Tax=Natronococcus sp. TaxID=35747 RepID=UPI0025D2E394|nr:hypothetical protein [Natronococcus sp.]
MTATEEPIARLTHWIRQRPNSIEFWELVVTDERLLCCFVGESYRSMLLRADMGERDRALVADSSPAELESLDEQNFSVPLEAVEGIRLVTGTRFRRAKLEIDWDDADAPSDGMTLVATSGAESQADVVAGLEDEPSLEDVDLEIERRGWF